MKTCVFAFRPSFRPRVRRRETASKKAHTTEHTKRTHGASVQTESGRFVWRVCSRVRLHEGDGQAVARVARRHDPQRRPGQHDHASGSRHVHGRRRRQVHPVHAVHPQGRPGGSVAGLANTVRRGGNGRRSRSRPVKATARQSRGQPVTTIRNRGQGEPFASVASAPSRSRRRPARRPGERFASVTVHQPGRATAEIGRASCRERV